LVTAAGGANTAGSKLKSSTGWNSYSGISSTDEFHFSALPGGYRYSDGLFYGAGNYGDWWPATEESGGGAYYRRMYYSYDGVSEGYGNANEYEDLGYKNDGFSARCVQD